MKTSFHLDNGDLTVKREADVEPIINQVNDLRQLGGKTKSGDMWHVGRIPAVVIEKYCNDKGVTFHDFLNDNAHVLSILNDPDYKAFRIAEGNL